MTEAWLDLIIVNEICLPAVVWLVVSEKCVLSPCLFGLSSVRGVGLLRLMLVRGRIPSTETADREVSAYGFFFSPRLG